MTTVMLEADRAHLRLLREKCVAVVGDALMGKKNAVILDAPAYQNSGDVLILHGVMTLLHQLGIHIRGVRDQRGTPWELLKNLPSDTAVILHGGGNFGGLYPRHDELRGRILSVVADPRSVVMMPQSVTFTDDASAQRARDLYVAARGATFLVRDSHSLQQFVRVLPELESGVRLCPDAAFATHLRPPPAPDVDVLVLARSDREARVSDWSSVVRDVPAVHTDWPALANDGNRSRELTRMNRLGAIVAAHQHLPPAVGRIAKPILGKAIDRAYRRSFERHIARHLNDIHATVSQGNVLLTDRLHAHVAACLMGVPNVALNNLDGKVAALYREWTHPLSYARFAKTEEEALAQVGDLRAAYNPPVEAQVGGVDEFHV